MGIALAGAAAQGGATLPVAQYRQQVADDLEVDEGAGTRAKGFLDFLSSGPKLSLDQERRGQYAARAAARGIYAHAVLGKSDPLLDRRGDGRHLERVVGHVEPGEPGPGRAALGLGSHHSPKRLHGQRKDLRVARKKELVGEQDRVIGRLHGPRALPSLGRQDLHHDAFLGADARGDDAGGVIRRPAPLASAGDAQIARPPRPARPSCGPRDGR